MLTQALLSSISDWPAWRMALCRLKLGLDLVREGLAEVQQKMAGVWKTVYGSELVKGEEVVFSGLTQAMLNGCKGYVKEWDADRAGGWLRRVASVF